MTPFLVTAPPTLFADPDAPPIEGAVRTGDVWTIAVDNLDALLDIVARHGSVTIERPKHTDILYRLTVNR